MLLQIAAFVAIVFNNYYLLQLSFDTVNLFIYLFSVITAHFSYFKVRNYFLKIHPSPQSLPTIIYIYRNLTYILNRANGFEIERRNFLHIK